MTVAITAVITPGLYWVIKGRGSSSFIGNLLGVNIEPVSPPATRSRKLNSPDRSKKRGEHQRLRWFAC
jgi:hypothetical protein